MTATDELRRLLDGRGAEHFDGCESTLWGYEQTSESTGAYRYSADEISGGFVNVWLYHLTPEQAIEATLGSDLKAENAKLRELVRDVYMALWTCNQYTCKHGKDGCYTEDGNNGGKCVLHDRMRELGVEV